MSWKLTNAYQQKREKSDAVRVAAALNKAKIACCLEWMIPRYGEYTDSGALKSYSLDILLIDPRYQNVGIEMEGDGSGSKDNPERDDYIKRLGITLLHFKNGTPSQSIIDLLNADFRRKD